MACNYPWYLYRWFILISSWWNLMQEYWRGKKDPVLKMSMSCGMENYKGESKAERSTREVVEGPWVVWVLLYWKAFQSSPMQTVWGCQLASLRASGERGCRKGGRVPQAGISSQVSFSCKTRILWLPDHGARASLILPSAVVFLWHKEIL